MNCRKCGAEIKENWKFCQSCGEVLNANQEQQEPVIDETTTNQLGHKILENQREWFYLDGSDKRGPFNRNEIAEQIRQGKIQRNTLVWATGMTDWLAAGESQLTKEFVNVIPLAPLSAISDRWIWALACIPHFISWIIGYFAISNGLEWWIPVFCTIAANIFFVVKDAEEVKKTGQDVGAWMFMGLILVPIYLYVRETKTNKKFAPCVIWCLLFIISLFV